MMKWNLARLADALSGTPFEADHDHAWTRAGQVTTRAPPRTPAPPVPCMD